MSQKSCTASLTGAASPCEPSDVLGLSSSPLPSDACELVPPGGRGLGGTDCGAGGKLNRGASRNGGTSGGLGLGGRGR
eukprot:318469-Chlamydomonas_euryale.AAC.2